MASKHPLQGVGIAAAFSFVAARTDQPDSFSPRNDALSLCKKLLFLGLHLGQLIVQGRQAHLFIYLAAFSARSFLCGVALAI